MINGIKRYLRNIGMEKPLFYLLFYLHLDKTSLENWKKNPTEKMLKSKEYFENNNRDINDVSNQLCDEMSKKVYLDTWKYKMTWDRKYMPKYSEVDQYFPKDIMNIGKMEVFVNCGAYNGDTIFSFVKRVKGEYKRIIAFEADKKTYVDLKKNIENKNIRSVIAYNNACWNKEEFIKFQMDHDETSKVFEGKEEYSDSLKECVGGGRTH